MTTKTEEAKLMYSEEEVRKIQTEAYKTGISTGSALIILQHLTHIHENEPAIHGTMIQIRKAFGDPCE